MVRDYYDDELQEGDDDLLKVAQEELKRVDHLVYVTLKYTRTVDVLINIIKRMIDAYEALIKLLFKIKKVDVPGSLIERTQKINALYPEELVHENLNLYMMLKKVIKAKNITREHEYRRPVAMKVFVDSDEVKIDIDTVTEFYAVMMSFYKFVETLSKNITQNEE